jgi:DNA-binding transcriptional ArsR family regulator
MEDSTFVKVFGRSPMVKLLDFFLAERGLYDYTLTEISENSGVSWTTLHRIFPKLLEMEIVRETREISRAKLYAINEEHPLVKKLVKLRNEISDYFIQVELQRQGKRILAATS